MGGNKIGEFRPVDAGNGRSNQYIQQNNAQAI